MKTRATPARPVRHRTSAAGARRRSGPLEVRREDRREDRLDRTLVALGDPTRRAILLRLARGEARVTDLAAPFDISLNSVSKHIRMLERAELVTRRRVGREHFLARNPRALDEAARWMSALQDHWNARLDRLEQALEGEET